MRILLLTWLVLPACGMVRDAWWVDDQETSSALAPALQQLEEKAQRYQEWIPASAVNGFILTDACDSLLFSGLYGAAVDSVDLTAAETTTAGTVVWHRNPEMDCSPAAGTSRSTISRDQIIGVLWWAWRHHRGDVVQSLQDDLLKTSFLLRGQGTPGELLVTPALANTIATMVRRLGGHSESVWEALPAVFQVQDGFADHLTAWHILLRGEMLGGITVLDKQVLRSLAAREQDNPLYQAAYAKYSDGDQHRALELLLSSPHWPNNRLPTTLEHCAEWPVQRDASAGTDWLPCSPLLVQQHTGAELVAIARLILGSDKQ